MEKIIKTGLWIFVMFNILDLITTKLFLAKGITEVNIIAVYLLNKFGFIALVWVKVIMLFIVYLLVLKLQEKKELAIATIFFAVGLYFLVILENIYVLI